MNNQKEEIIFIEKSQEIVLDLNNPGEEKTIVAIIVARGEEEIDLKVSLKHNAPETKGHFYLRTLAFDKAKIDFYGTVVVPKESYGADSYLSHHGLIMSKKAATHTTPCLEIENSDIEAGHSATIGHLDEDVLFYLENRGINAEEAKEILLEGFIRADFEKIKNSDIREEAEEILQGKI
jgi:Fe-S cluster assembly protein SufD